MKYRELVELNDFRHGNIIRIVSYSENCGIDETIYTALVVDMKKGLIAIPQDFQSYLYQQAVKGAYWEMKIEWLLSNDVEVFLLQWFDEIELMGAC